MTTTKNGIELYNSSCNCCGLKQAKFHDINENRFCSEECADFYYYGTHHCPYCDSKEYECIDGKTQDIEYKCKNCGKVYCEQTTKVNGELLEIGF